MKKHRKLNQQKKQSREKNTLSLMALKAVVQSVLRKVADHLLWEVFELDQFSERLLCLIRDFFEDE